jgi:hypothetical protein
MANHVLIIAPYYTTGSSAQRKWAWSPPIQVELGDCSAEFILLRRLVEAEEATRRFHLRSFSQRLPRPSSITSMRSVSFQTTVLEIRDTRIESMRIVDEELGTYSAEFFGRRDDSGRARMRLDGSGADDTALRLISCSSCGLRIAWYDTILTASYPLSEILYKAALSSRLCYCEGRVLKVTTGVRVCADDTALRFDKLCKNNGIKNKLP